MTQLPKCGPMPPKKSSEVTCIEPLKNFTAQTYAFQASTAIACTLGYKISEQLTWSLEFSVTTSTTAPKCVIHQFICARSSLVATGRARHFWLRYATLPLRVPGTKGQRKAQLAVMPFVACSCSGAMPKGGYRRVRHLTAFKLRE